MELNSNQKPNIVYVHGASSTPVSFNYIYQNLPKHNRHDFTYDCSKPIKDTIIALTQFYSLSNFGDECYLVGHSMGGIIATVASYIRPAKKAIIISSPLAGSKAATYLKWMFPKYGLFDNISMNSPAINKIQEKGAVIPTLNIITEGGESPVIKEKNDGVVSVESQSSLKNCTSMIFNLNHFEVLLSPDVVREIKNFLWDSSK